MSCSLSAACCLRLVANWKCGVSLINSVEHLLIFNIRILSSVNWGVGGAGWLIANGSGRGFGLYFICGLFCCALGICLTHFPSVFHTLLFSFYFFSQNEKLSDLLFLMLLPVHRVYLCPHCRLAFLLWHCGDCSAITLTPGTLCPFPLPWQFSLCVTLSVYKIWR